MLNELIDKREHCKAKSKINRLFDYILMSTKLLLKIVTTSKKIRKI